MKTGHNEGAEIRLAAARLSAEHGIRGAIRFFVSPLGGIVAELRHGRSAAVIAGQGAQVLSYTPAGMRDVLWRSMDARLDTGRALRGGIPVCWPWFGVHPDDPAKPSHGFARASPWRAVSSASDAASARLRFAFETGPEHEELWPYRALAELEVALSDRLSVELMTTNLDTRPFDLTAALHSYFAVGDIGEVRVLGLEGQSYMDHVGEKTRRTQTAPILIGGEADRVFDRSEDTVVIEDNKLRRRMRIAKSGSRATVVWNPWIEKSKRMGDMGANGYRRMVCVETANAGEDVIALEPGGEHTLRAEISAEPM